MKTETIKTKPLLDTLNYVKILQDNGVDKAQTHTIALAQVLTENLYTKNDIDMKFEQTLNRFDQIFHQFELRQEKRWAEYDNRWAEYRLDQEKQRAQQQLVFEKHCYEQAKQFNQIRKEMLAIELRFEKTMNHYFVTTMSVLGSLIVVVGAVSTFAHAIFH